jgi:hypothetical protein
MQQLQRRRKLPQQSGSPKSACASVEPMICYSSMVHAALPYRFFQSPNRLGRTRHTEPCLPTVTGFTVPPITSWRTVPVWSKYGNRFVPKRLWMPG